MKKESEQKIVRFLAKILCIEENGRNRLKVAPKEFSPRELLLENDGVNLAKLCKGFDECEYPNNIKTPSGMLYMYDMICSEPEVCAEYHRRFHRKYS